MAGHVCVWTFDTECMWLVTCTVFLRVFLVPCFLNGLQGAHAASHTYICEGLKI